MRAQLIVVFCMLATAAVATAATPYPMVVVVGPQSRSALRLLPPTATPEGEWQRMQDLAEMLGSDPASSLALLATPAACGDVSRADCTELTITTDARLLETIEKQSGPEVLVSRPVAGVWTKEQVYYARLEVMLVKAQPPHTRLRSFVVSYHESECDRTCTTVAHRYAAEEFHAMIEHMLSVELSPRPKALPPSWQDKPRLKHVARWSNACVKDVSNHRLIRDDRDRAWIGSLATTGSSNRVPSLTSVSWTGCT